MSFSNRCFPTKAIAIWTATVRARHPCLSPTLPLSTPAPTSSRSSRAAAAGARNRQGDADHVWIVGSYFHFAGNFTKPAAKDISPNPGKSDPMYVVFARKAGGGTAAAGTA